MQALYDFAPVLAFFVTFKFAGIYVATSVLLAATVALVAWQWLATRKISPMLLVSAGLALLFGGLTLVFHNELFIMWKPTVVYLLFAAALSFSQIAGDKPLVQKMLEAQIVTDARTWRLSNASWALFFVVLAAVNLVFVYRFSREAWVTWKLVAVGIMLLFTIAQSVWLASRAQTPAEPR